MTNSNEAFSRVVIDAQLADQGWSTQDPNSVRYEYVLPDGTRADYVLSHNLTLNEFRTAFTATNIS